MSLYCPGYCAPTLRRWISSLNSRRQSSTITRGALMISRSWLMVTMFEFCQRKQSQRISDSPRLITYHKHISKSMLKYSSLLKVFGSDFLLLKIHSEMGIWTDTIWTIINNIPTLTEFGTKITFNLIDQVTFNLWLWYKCWSFSIWYVNRKMSSKDSWYSSVWCCH